jgi:hypothetical protein
MERHKCTGPAAEGTTDAELNPWTVVGEDDNACLFGFALRHPRTGGLAWTLSTPIVSLDERRQQAVTRSGRRYTLGRRVSPDALPDEEAEVAYALLVGPLLGWPAPIEWSGQNFSGA